MYKMYKYYRDLIKHLIKKSKNSHFAHTLKNFKKTLKNFGLELKK